MKMDCPICIEKYNKTKHKKILCFHCQKPACLNCVKKFILSNICDAKCMYCNIKWDRRFMVNNLTKVFCDKDYRFHRNKILKERCKCMLQSLTPILVLKHNHEETMARVRSTVKERNRLNRKLSELENDMCQISKKIRLAELSFVKQQNITESNGLNDIQRPCITENCLGFIDNKGFCPVCKQTTCLRCNVYKSDEDHECLEHDVLNWQTIKKTTKACPSCRTRIFKITGCDQMWCTFCNTAFSWSRETIERGTVHNPHYFDWLFDTGGRMNINIENMECNEHVLPHILQLKSVIENDPKKRLIINLYRQLSHLNEVEIPILQGLYYNPDNLTVNEIYRKKLLPFLYSLIKNKNCDSTRQDLERFDYQFMCNLECVEILQSYIRQQIYAFHRLCSKSVSTEDFVVNHTETKNFYEVALTKFEKEYKKKYGRIKSKL